MKKQRTNKNIIFLLVIFIIIAMSIDGILFIKFSKNRIQKEQQYIIKENSIVVNLYECSLNSYTMEQQNLVYTEKYGFAWGVDGLIDGQIILEFSFKEKNSYHNFVLSSSKEFVEPTIESDDIKLIKKYIYDAELPSKNNDLDIYLEELNKQGYSCNKKR